MNGLSQTHKRGIAKKWDKKYGGKIKPGKKKGKK